MSKLDEKSVGNIIRIAMANDEKCRACEFRGTCFFACACLSNIYKHYLKETEKMTLYVVHGNTYYGGYGHVENIFGVYTEKDSAEAAKDLIEKRLYEENKDREWSIVDDLSDIAVGILEIEANEILDIELGGYCE